MCDYSLCGLPTRLAVEGEELAVHRFRTGSMGLASRAELTHAERLSAPSLGQGLWNYLRSVFEESQVSPPITAVCVPPGTQLILKNIPDDLRRRWKVAKEEPVRFLQMSASAYSYRDAVHFRNGRDVLLQSLREGMRVQVASVGDSSDRFEKDLAVPVL